VRAAADHPGEAVHCADEAVPSGLVAFGLLLLACCFRFIAFGLLLSVLSFKLPSFRL